MQPRLFATSLFVLSLVSLCRAAEPDTSRGDAMLREYFRQETQKLADACLADIKTLEDWMGRREEYRRQLLEMLGLDPLPEKTPLNPVVTGTIDHDQFTVENLHFQSRPRLYVTGNLYIPKGEGPFPTVLYVCGHSRNVKDGVSYGNKVGYHHHGVWFARNGYMCLTIDTLQLGEIEGLHHGTYGREVDGQWQHQWWWNSRGYTPAGVEAWNCVRALDYLETRPEVDRERIGVTGRSGGGAYSWWIAAIDDRIKCAVPVAGITDLQNHVYDGSPGRLADGCVEGHCDCMYIVNTYRWDYPLVAALVAPRPLLVSNSDKDSIFPLDGIVRVHEKVRRIYRLYDKEENLGLQITEGPHLDTQVLRIHAFHWFNRHLKGEEPLIEMAATKIFEPEQLQVFAGGALPTDEINTTIQQTFVPTAAPRVPQNQDEWEKLQAEWMTALKERVFRGWPTEPEPLAIEEAFSSERDGIEISGYDFTSQGPIRLRLYVSRPASGPVANRAVLYVTHDAGWQNLTDEAGHTASDEDLAHRFAHLLKAEEGQITCWVAPRGVGPTAWSGDARKQGHIRRRFMLLGQTLDGMRVWDVIRAAAAVRELDAAGRLPLALDVRPAGDGASARRAAATALYASLYIPNVAGCELAGLLPPGHDIGPDLLNVRRYLDMPQAAAMAIANSGSTPEMVTSDGEEWQYVRDVAARLGWDRPRGVGSRDGR